MSELEEILNQSAEQIRAKSADSLTHLNAIALALNGILTGAISTEPEQLEQAKTHAATLQNHLDALGIQTNAQLENFPERLHNLYFAPQQGETFQENADQLEAIADRIEYTSKLAVQAIRTMARQQRDHFNHNSQS